MMKKLIRLIKNLFNQNDSPSDVIVTTQGWLIEIEGTIKNISKIDVDKSGHNPKYMYFFQVTKDSFSIENCDFELENLLEFRGKEKDIIQQLGKIISIGDRVKIKSSGIEKNPRIFPMTKISLIQ